MVEFIANFGIQTIYVRMLKVVFNSLLSAYHMITKYVILVLTLITENVLQQEIQATFVIR
jgi:phage shock protein PspC (stress-responsive transcriptional regulator)